jgi:hypothetical protein
MWGKHLTRRSYSWVNPSGAFFRIKTSVFDSLCMFHERYKNGGEDTDLFFKAHLYGYSFDMVETPVIHAVSKSTGRGKHNAENHARLLSRWSRNDVQRVVEHARKKQPLVSIVIAHLPHRPLRCIGSVKKQTYANIEIIVEPDTFGDGAAKTRNNGISNARGRYILFLDDDKELHPHFLDEMVYQLENSDYDFCYCDYEMRGDIKGTHRAQPFNLDELKRKNYIDMCSLIHFSCLEYFDETLKRYIDWDLFLRIGMNGGNGKYLNKILFYSNYEADGISTRGEEDRKYWENVVRKKHNIEVTE